MLPKQSKMKQWEVNGVTINARSEDQFAAELLSV